MDTVFANPDSVCLEIKQAPTDLQCSNKIEILNVASSFDFWAEIHRNSQGSIWQPCEKSGEGESRGSIPELLGSPAILD